MPKHCPMCGAAVRVVGSDEGTMHYQPCDEARLRSEAERETVRRITARLRVDADGCANLGKFVAADALVTAADAIDRDLGGEG